MLNVECSKELHKGSLVKKYLSCFFPVIYTPVTRYIDIVRTGEEVSFAGEMNEVSNMVVDHMIAINHALISTQHQLLPGKKGEMLKQPIKLIS
jgi:hypothetical protein